MQLDQIPTFTVCHACDGYGSTQDRGGFDLRYPVLSSDLVDCESCGGQVLIQSGDLCRSSVQSPDVVGQESNQCLKTSDCLCLDCCNRASLWSDDLGQGGN